MTRITDERLRRMASEGVGVADAVALFEHRFALARELLLARAVVEAARKAVDEYRPPRLPSLAAALTAYDEAQQ